MANTLYVAVYDSAQSGITWARANIATRSGFSGATGYVASIVDGAIRSTDGDEVGNLGAVLSAGTSYKLWAIVDDGSTSSNSGTPFSSGMFVYLAHTEAASASDTPAALAVWGRVATEAAIATDTASSTAQRSGATTEAASATDQVSTGSAAYSVDRTEAASAVDAPSSSATLPASLADATSASDQPAAIATFARALTEPATATDTSNWGGAIYSVSLGETATASDALATAQQLLAAQIEAGNAADGLALVAAFGVAQLEPATAVDAVQAARQMLALLSEPGVAADSVASSMGQVYAATLAEAASAATLVTVQVGPLLVVMSAAPTLRRAAGPSRPAQLHTARRTAPTTGYRQ